MGRFTDLLAEPGPLILDGATGTELERRGVDIGLPLWSANALLAAPDTLRQVHADYLQAGAAIITTNTFRTHRRSLAKSNHGSQSRQLTRLAVTIAREAAAAGAAREANPPGGRAPLVAGSMAPLEDCYAPHLVPSDLECQREHGEMADVLAEAGVDFLLVETMNTIREAAAAARAAVATGLDTAVSVVCGPDGRLLSGESLAEAARALAPLGIAAMGVNCTPAPVIGSCLAELRGALGSGMPLIAYGNIGYADPQGNWVSTDSVDPEAYARHAATWRAAVVGGCCGTRPAHIERLAALRRP